MNRMLLGYNPDFDLFEDARAEGPATAHASRKAVVFDTESAGLAAELLNAASGQHLAATFGQQEWSGESYGESHGESFESYGETVLNAAPTWAVRWAPRSAAAWHRRPATRWASKRNRSNRKTASSKAPSSSSGSLPTR